MVAEIHALEPPSDEPAGVLRLPQRKPEDSEPKKEKRIPVFYIGDTMYTVPAEPGADISLTMLRLMNTRGQEAAVYYMLTTMLGEDGYRALMEYKDLPPKALEQVVKRINDIAAGNLEGPKAP